MHSECFNMAKEYYDRLLWSEKRIAALVRKGKLTADEYAEITGEAYK